MSEFLRVLRSSSKGYDLRYPDGRIETHSFRGKISYRDEKIIIGDFVSLDEEGFIDQIQERRNQLSRPRLSNVDDIFVLVSSKEPDFSSYLLDKFLSMVDFSCVKASIVITKCDLLKKRAYNSLVKRLRDYVKIGFDTYLVDCHDLSMYDGEALKKGIQGKSVAFIGQTGVGKSSLLNSLYPEFDRKVDSLYVASGRGRHTTKEVILLPVENGYLFDTPGFSAFDMTDMKTLDLAKSFPGYQKYFGTCFFKDCKHLKGSKGCKVLEALDEGELSMDSYENYLKISEECKENEKWKKKL